MGAGVSNLDIQEEEAFEVWSCNWESFRAFLACETQWRVALGMAGAVWLGLDYSGVDVVLRRTGAAEHVFEDLQLMEGAALRAFAEAEA